VFQCFPIFFFVLAIPNTTTTAREFQLCVNYLEAKKDAVDQVVERFSSLEQRLIPEILRSNADLAMNINLFDQRATGFAVRWATPAWTPRYPILWDGIQYEVKYAP
jgi:hypothetical protein